MELVFISIRDSYISQDVLERFDCGHLDFNDFIHSEAVSFQETGNGVTYILVDEQEYKSKSITRVYAFATIKTAALHHQDNDVTLSEPCAEIKYFAISKKFQKVRGGSLGTGKYYSTLFFEKLLELLYEMSINSIGFTMIFLRANSSGEKLYRRKHFVDATNYILPYDIDDSLGKCTPMCLPISDNLYSIFGVE